MSGDRDMVADLLSRYRKRCALCGGDCVRIESVVVTPAAAEGAVRDFRFRPDGGLDELAVAKHPWHRGGVELRYACAAGCRFYEIVRTDEGGSWQRTMGERWPAG